MKKKIFTVTLVLICSFNLFCTNAFAVNTVTRVGFNSNNAPYQFVNESGNLVGFHIDLLSAIIQDKNTLVEYIPYANDEDCVQALNDGLIDIAVGVTKNAAKKWDVLITDSISSSNLCLAAPNAIAERILESNTFSGLTAVIDGDYLSTVLSLHKGQHEKGLGTCTFLSVDNSQKVVDYLIKSKADFAICEKNSAQYLLKEQNCQDDYTLVYNYLADVDYYLAIRTSDQSLLPRLNEAISNVRITGQYSHMLGKWIAQGDSYKTQRIIRNTSAIIAVIIVAALIYYYISQRIRSMLKNKINEQTIELQNTNNKLTNNLKLIEEESVIRSRIIEDSPSGMLMFTDNGEILLINKKAYELLSISKSNFIPTSINQIDLLKSILQQIDKTSTTSVIISCYDDGRLEYFRCIIYHMPGGKKQDWLLSFENVTHEEQSKQEQIDIEKNKILNTLIAGIAHEIKNPLMAIKTFCSAIIEQKNNPDFLESFARYVPAETERINKLVESLMNYARPARGIKAQICVMHLLEDCIGLVQSLIKKCGATVVCEGDESIGIFAYQDSLRQALINYLMNAIESVAEKQFSEGQQGKIDVCCYCQENRCQILIIDNGIGMTNEQQQHCMEPFYTKKAKGTGLGMSIALQAVKESGGTVRVESKWGSYSKVILEFEVAE